MLAAYGSRMKRIPQKESILAKTEFLNPIPIEKNDDPNGVAFASMNKYKGKVPGRLLILVDTWATDHIICNSALLKNIGPADIPKTVVTNAGVGEVYYHPNAVMNVLSLSKLEDDDNLVIDYVPGKRFTTKNVTTGKMMRFERKYGLFVTHVDYGLLYSSFSKRINGNVTPYVSATIQTVVKKGKGHTYRDVARAKAVLPLIQALGYPSRKDLRKMINAKSIANCPVTLADVDRFYRIYGGVEGAIKGMTVRKPLIEVNVDENKTDIPQELTKELEKVTMSLDIFYVDRIPYLTTISRKLLFTTARALQRIRT